MKIEHIAFIMDGNRRYGKLMNLSKNKAYSKGLETMFSMIKNQVKHGIKHTSFFALSADNYNKRTKEEIGQVLELAQELYKRRDIREFLKTNNVKIDIVGDVDKITSESRKELAGTGKVATKLLNELSKMNSEVDTPKFIATIALHYDGQLELVEAVKDIAAKVKEGEMALNEINEDTIKSHIWFKQTPPEIIVRPGDAPRLSGFMLWDSKYSEIYLTKKMWPEFDDTIFEEILLWYQGIKRNFGV